MKLLCISTLATVYLPMVLSLTEQRHLQLTALLSTKDDPQARFECWQIAQPFATYPTVGTAIPGLANLSNISYVKLPPRSAEGLHKPPHPMFFVLLSGLAHVTLPDGDDELWIMEGVNGLMIAADVYGDGHYTRYPSDKASVALQLPFEGGKMPEHQVVNEGVCKAMQGSGISSTMADDAARVQIPIGSHHNERLKH